ncbi:hypothetical protein EJ02DRAFT_467141 [Clathrospora elynae]|uniref:CBF1-interacting co-repressor CIR N-terminal domain-containing protein n=1 Tax=Clathrospora elynae TaxID=706981 RepID=A0A6A5SKP0_9PLEO|nr:hypothetical protein EJ02DRAFT_467141 [Clathrospora elynae]
MPLHLLSKKSWNVYNADNIARVKADEIAAAAHEAADEQRMQELDAERRAAILRGRTPPPLPEEATTKDYGPRTARDQDDRGHDRKRRKLAGEDETDMDIRLAKSATAPRGEGETAAKVLKLRNTASDAPLTDHAGNIDLFPVDMKEAIECEKNAEAETEKRKKEKALEDQYTMRLANAAGRGGLGQPWYTAQQKPAQKAAGGQDLTIYDGFVNKNVWGNEDPRRKERAQSRITTNDPFAFMQKAQAQLQRSKQDKKQWAEERDRELRELRATQEREDRRARHHKRKQRDDDHVENYDTRHGRVGDGSSRHRHRHGSRGRDRSHDRQEKKSSYTRETKRSRSRSKERDPEHRHGKERHTSRDRFKTHGLEVSRSKATQRD